MNFWKYFDEMISRGAEIVANEFIFNTGEDNFSMDKTFFDVTACWLLVSCLLKAGQ